MSGSSPNWTKGYIPSASEWNSWWAKKLDSTYVPPAAGLPITGGTVTGNTTFTAKVTINTLNLTGIPTSNAGLTTGDVYLNGGFLMVMP